MDEQDRKAITRNLVKLVKETNLESLVTKLKEKNVFPQRVMQKFENNAVPEENRKRDLYLEIQTRGPQAFQNLLESLMETGHFDLARVLEPQVDPEEYLLTRSSQDMGARHSTRQKGAVPMRLPAYVYREEPGFLDRMQDLAIHQPTGNVNLTTEPLVVNVIPATTRLDKTTKRDLQVYPMGTYPKGHLLMINNVEFMNDIENERKGALVDEHNLEAVFGLKGLGFEVEKHRDQGLEDMKRKISTFAQKPEHRDHSACVVALLSHGRRGTEREATHVVASDGGTLATEWVLSQFTNDKSYSTINKPKIFIFQCCRGDTHDYGVRPVNHQWGGGSGRVQTDGLPGNLVPMRTYTDMLIAHSTVPGYVSHRDRYEGTWFIQALCRVFMEHACDTDLGDMLIMVDSMLARYSSENGTIQTCCYENRGFKKLYFNPGLYD